MTSPGLGGEDPAILHDDLRIQRPPTARALLHHETRDIPGTWGQGLSSVRTLSLQALILSQMASVKPMIQVENMKDAKYFVHYLKGQGMECRLLNVMPTKLKRFNT